MKIVNLTPHKISLYKDDILVRTFEPEGLARATQKSIVVDNIDGIDVCRNIYGDVSGLPEEAPDTFYIVSKIVMDACPSRNDLLLPNDSVRNEQGQIVGCRSFARK
jgi:hypothetical protein